MNTLLIAGISILAGWLVNVAADTLPHGQPLRQRLAAGWDWPVRQFFALQSTDLPYRPVARPRRTLLVFAAAQVLGYLALARSGALGFNLLIAAYAWFFLAVAVIDLEHRRVLNVMLLAFAPVALLASFWTQTPAWGSALAGGLLGFGVFLVIALIRPGGMGMGDVKLAGAIGLVTGLNGVLTALTIGIFAGGFAALGIILGSRMQRTGSAPAIRSLTLAYAPYLVLGAWVALYRGG